MPNNAPDNTTEATNIAPLATQSTEVILNYTTDARLTVLSALRNLPVKDIIDDVKLLNTFISLTNSIDHTQLGKARLAQDSSADETMRLLASQMIREYKEQGRTQQQQPVFQREIEDLPANLPPVKMLDGEMTVGVVSQSFQEFNGARLAEE